MIELRITCSQRNTEVNTGLQVMTNGKIMCVVPSYCKCILDSHQCLATRMHNRTCHQRLILQSLLFKIIVLYCQPEVEDQAILVYIRTASYVFIRPEKLLYSRIIVQQLYWKESKKRRYRYKRVPPKRYAIRTSQLCQHNFEHNGCLKALSIMLAHQVNNCAME